MRHPNEDDAHHESSRKSSKSECFGSKTSAFAAKWSTADSEAALTAPFSAREICPLENLIGGQEITD
jgi:hypothetical protein